MRRGLSGNLTSRDSMADKLLIGLTALVVARFAALFGRVLAWAPARNGQCGSALSYSKLPLRLGTQDTLKFFHRGMIERCLGHGDEAQTWFRRALDLNPHFSILWAPIARRYV